MPAVIRKDDVRRGAYKMKGCEVGRRINGILKSGFASGGARGL